MKINLENAKVIKTVKGFGGSACWWSPQVKSEKTAHEIANLLYGDDGLRMNIYRFNVGGGYEKDNLRIENPWRYVESFMNKDGSFDYSKDKYAVNMMKKCLSLGNIDTLIFFANSPHFTQTVTGQTSGGFTEHFSNLDKSKYEAFAKYFIDIAEHFSAEGYPVKYISPINEPQWKWGGASVWQEGCHYEAQEVYDCFLAFAKELEKRNSSLKLYGPESGNIKDHTKEYYNLLSSNELIMKYLDVFAYHSYGSDDNVSEKAEFGKWAKENIKTPRFDMSEWCELPCKNDTKSIESALIMARIIGEDLIYTGVDSWSAWVCANQWDNAVRDGKCFSDGFIVAKDDFSDYYVAKRYYAMAHFSKCIPNGSKSLDIGFNTSRGFSVFAFERADGKKVIIAVNNSKANRTIEFDKAFDKCSFIETTQDYEFDKSEMQNVKKLVIKPKSLVTVILK